MFTGQITLQPRSTNAQPFSMDLAPITINLTAEVTLAGDYNDDGVVNAADYVRWRNTNGQNVTLPGDPTPGSVTQADYDVWAGNFGSVASGGGLAAESAVPEPATAIVFALASLAVVPVRQR
jgi:hypothetical protein